MENARKYLTLLLLIVPLVSGCSSEKDKEELSKEVEATVSEALPEESGSAFKQEVQNFKLEGFSRSGDSQWSVEGKFANIVEPDIVLSSLKGESVSQKIAVQISADKGVYNKDQKSAELQGHVVIMLSDGGMAFMDYAKWDAVGEEITTDSPVRIEHSGVVVEGIGGIVRPQLEWALLKTAIKMTDSTGRVITCDGPLEVVYKEKKAILNNNVVIVDPKQGTMSSDKVIAYFDAEKREISRIEWIGNVKAVY